MFLLDCDSIGDLEMEDYNTHITTLLSIVWKSNVN